jgi:hypothetical protein
MKRLWMRHGLCLLLVGGQALCAVYDDTEIDRDFIDDAVAQEIAAQVQAPQEPCCAHHKARRQCRGGQRTDGAIYLLPHWPYYTQFFQDNDLVQLSFTFDTASHAYSGHGGSEQLSQLIFGEPAIHIQNILLASALTHDGKLMAQAPLNSVSLTEANHYLSILADQNVDLHASLDEYTFAVDYDRHFGDFTVGFHIPLKMRHQRLKLTNDISPNNYKKLKYVESGYNAEGTAIIPGLAQATQFHFYEQFDGLASFFTEILSRKGIAFNQKQTTAGLSDVVAYATFDFRTRPIDRIVTGLSLLMPTASGRDVGKLWNDDLGNGGFVELAAFGSLAWLCNRWFNPAIHLKGSYGFSGNVNRRVSMRNTYDGESLFNGSVVIGPNQPAHGLIIFGETLNFIEQVPFDHIDASARCFSDHAVKVKIQPGPELFLRIGNTFDAVFTNKGFFDIFYDLHAKGKDYILRHTSDDLYQPALLGHNTALVSHTIGATYAYQFDAQFRMRVGLDYVFAGRNAPKTFEVMASLNAEF